MCMTAVSGNIIRECFGLVFFRGKTKACKPIKCNKFNWFKLIGSLTPTSHSCIVIVGNNTCSKLV